MECLEMLKISALPNILFFSTSKVYKIQFVNIFGQPESAALAFKLDCNFLYKSQQL